MSNEEFILLAEKVAKGDASAAELALYNAAYDSFQSSNLIKVVLPANIDALEETSIYNLRENLGIQSRSVKLWPRIAAVAAAVTAITLGVWLYYASNLNGRHSDAGQDPARAGYAKNDIAPGKNTATLTLANGKTIQLSDAKTGVVIDASSLTYSDGEELSISSASGPRRGGPEASSETTQFPGSRTMSVSTPRGGQYRVVLPDGTKVWLNAESKISFPSQFIGKIRKISLSGEGYFEVAHNKSKPFIVETGGSKGGPGQRIEVLGTHFNLNTFGDEHAGTVTSLLEGSVRVSTAEGSRVLKPGERGASTIKGILLLKGNAADDIDWKEGRFVFEEERLEEIMAKVSRWYNVKISYEDDAVKEDRYGGTLSRFDNVSKVLRKLEATGDVRFEIEGAGQERSIKVYQKNK